MDGGDCRRSGWDQGCHCARGATAPGVPRRQGCHWATHHCTTQPIIPATLLCLRGAMIGHDRPRAIHSSSSTDNADDFVTCILDYLV